MSKRLFGIILLCFSPAVALASDIMFEGYYKVELENKPVGFAIQRYSFDPKSQTFESTSFLYAKTGDKIVQESLKAKATDKFHPISYQYTSQVGADLKMIDATFSGDKMKLKINDSKKIRDETYKIPKGTFLSTFLPYLLLQQKLDLTEAYKYSAVAEEDGNSFWGKAWLKNQESKPGYKVFTIYNKFKDEEFISKMAVVKDPKDANKNVKGEVLSTDSPAKNITSHLVASADLAIAGQQVPKKTLLAVFGGIPSGKVNMITAPPAAIETEPKAGAAARPPAKEINPAKNPEQ